MDGRKPPSSRGKTAACLVDRLNSLDRNGFCMATKLALGVVACPFRAQAHQLSGAAFLANEAIEPWCLVVMFWLASFQN